MRMRIAGLLLGISLLTSCTDGGTGPTADPSGTPTSVTAPGEGSDCIPSESSHMESREDLVGQPLSDVRAAETAAGHDIRVLGEDGVCADAHDDLNPQRVNVVVQDGKVIWASMY